MSERASERASERESIKTNPNSTPTDGLVAAKAERGGEEDPILSKSSYLGFNGFFSLICVLKVLSANAVTVTVSNALESSWSRTSMVAVESPSWTVLLSTE